MAGFKVLGLAVLLAAAAALLAAAATAVDDEHMYHWKCFTSCNTRCRDEDNAAAKVDGAGSGLNASASVLGGGGHRCKKGCLNECFENFPVLCYQQCVVGNCLCKPPYSKEKMECMKMCCDKCFHNGPAPPMPPKPTPPKPSPPKPSPPKPSPPQPSPPKPSPPKPSPPVPKPPSPPKPSPPKPPRPPCPPAGGEKVTGDTKN